MAHGLLDFRAITQHQVKNLSRNWYVLYSNPYKEQQAEFHLNLKGIETFFPRLHVPGTRESKARVIPLFRNYLFVRIELATEYHLVVWTPGVRRIVSFGSEPIPVQDSVIQFLRKRADARGIIPACCRLQCRQEVEISGGPFGGLMGIIQTPPDDKGRVKVLLKLLNRQVSIKFGVESIKGGRSSWAPSVVSFTPN